MKRFKKGNRVVKKNYPYADEVLDDGIIKAIAGDMAEIYWMDSTKDNSWVYLENLRLA